jgi:hypothetical protein
MMLIALVFLSFFIACCDFIEDGYKGIKPLHSSKASVEQMLGKPQIDENGYHKYMTADGFLRVVYTTKPCSENNLGRGDFSVAENTVLSYRVLLTDKPAISDLTFDRQRFPRSTSEHLLNYASYVNKDNSISILAMNTRDGQDKVYEIAYRPTKEDSEKYKCS